MSLRAARDPKLRLPLDYVLRSKLFGLKRLFMANDDFDWHHYNTHYRAEIIASRPHLTDDLSTVEWRLVNGKLFLRADSKPVHPVQVCLSEIVVNLQPKSIAEIGMGGGRYLAGFRHLLGDAVQLLGFDLSQAQMVLFRELYPSVASTVQTAELDITKQPIAWGERPELVLASTVFMHIQRAPAYEEGLKNFIASTTKWAVLMDNYTRHDYYRDFQRPSGLDGKALGLYVYDTGRTLAIVVTVDGSTLPPPYERLVNANQLLKYHPQ